MLSQLGRSKEELAVYDEILGCDPASTKALINKGWALISLRSYEEALGIFDHALQLDPSSSGPVTGKKFIFRHVFHKPAVQEHSDASRKQAAYTEALAQPFQSA